MNRLSNQNDLSPILPSVFELIAQERLTKFVRSGLHQTLKLIKQTAPLSKTWNLLYQHKDELVLVIEGVLQWFYLHFYSALAGEHFYGFRRTANHRLRSLIFSVFLPYVKRKLKSFEKQLQSEKTSPNVKFCLILRILPKIQVFLEAISWLYRLSYGFGLSTYYSPSLQFANVQLTYAKEPSPLIPRSSFSRNLVSLISQIIAYGLFIVQIIDWWNNLNESDKSMFSLTKRAKRIAQRGERSCWLCREPCQQMTGILGSGYVYCRVCIFDYVDRYHRCPITHQLVTREHLICFV